MPRFGPIARTDLIHYLRRLGFDGPYAGGKHQFMIKQELRLRIPNPHQADIGKQLLRALLRQADISVEEWEKL
jgi:predicted RNA binding protein YcfA (HicA-like mRNA interferase family)